MAIYKHSSSAVFTRFFDPVLSLYAYSDRQYDCPEFTDLDFLEMGILRCLSDSRTGRDFLQRHGDHGRKEIPVDLFFKGLKSNRRLENARSINAMLAALMTGRCQDPFAAIAELDDFWLYAGDGHYHAAAAHDPKSESSSGENKKRATGHFFMLNLRTHHLGHLTLAEQGGVRKGEHDMHAIKRVESDALRGGAPKGRKVIIAWDRAGIDFAHWNRLKRCAGLYFISREKENMRLIKCGERPIDRSDERNAGVIADENAGPGSGGAMLRRITYIDPLENTRYTFITTEMTLPPGILVLIYKQRWDIEKVFDELKSKLAEKKSWASNRAAKSAHAQFLCVAHNLMVLIEEQIRRQEGTCLPTGRPVCRQAGRQRAGSRAQRKAQRGGRRKRRELHRHRAPTLHGAQSEIHPLVEELRLSRGSLGRSARPPQGNLRLFLIKVFHTVALSTTTG